MNVVNKLLLFKINYMLRIAAFCGHSRWSELLLRTSAEGPAIRAIGSRLRLSK